MSYKDYTPGIYTTEVSALPSTITQVATSIPAFIGYTEMAKGSNGENLTNIPVQITSELAYKQYFGAAPSLHFKSIILDEGNNVKEASLSAPFYLYDSIHLFYANGGRQCYVVSIGSYTNEISKTAFTDGLAAIENEEEPTLLLFPDAANLTPSNLAEVQEAALIQCSTLKNRFAILDLQNNRFTELEDAVSSFRNNLNMDHLDYGAAYTPWLEIPTKKPIQYQDIRGKIVKNGLVVKLIQVLNDPKTHALIQEYETIIADINTIDQDIQNFLTENNANSLEENYYQAVKIYTDDPTSVEKYRDILLYLFKLSSLISQWAADTDNGGDLTQGETLNNYAIDLAGRSRNLTNLFNAVQNLVYYDYCTTEQDLSDITGYEKIYYSYYYIYYGWQNINWYSSVYFGDSASEQMTNALPELDDIVSTILSSINDIQNYGSSLLPNCENALNQYAQDYQNLMKGITANISRVPPSGAMAGVYAYTDSNVGVWKAPANVGVNSIIGPVEKINDATQEGLNVDPTSGKSINAIRSFTDKGTLVWGARTLAGNDNNWRYISVRRLFIMVEESVQKSISWAVFEPNVATTWMKVKASIENYLTNLWREGALAGNKTNEAFFVNVGLGITMTEDDILNGKMTVVIGMAPVRPAEFILLKFTQTVQNS